MLETRGLTAINRVNLSRPVALALNDGIIRADRSFFDFGCGRGTDVAALVGMGIPATGWDPVHNPAAERSRADVVNLGYVVNVIENPQERREALRQAWQLSTKVLVIAARLDWDIKAEQAVPFSDGVITAKGTFQKFFSQDELQGWVEECLGVQADAAAPGVFYVFRLATDREAHLARLPHRRQASAAAPPSFTLDRNRDVLCQRRASRGASSRRATRIAAPGGQSVGACR